MLSGDTGLYTRSNRLSAITWAGLTPQRDACVPFARRRGGDRRPLERPVTAPDTRHLR